MTDQPRDLASSRRLSWRNIRFSRAIDGGWEFSRLRNVSDGMAHRRRYRIKSTGADGWMLNAQGLNVRVKTLREARQKIAELENAS